MPRKTDALERLEKWLAHTGNSVGGMEKTAKGWWIALESCDESVITVTGNALSAAIHNALNQMEAKK